MNSDHLRYFEATYRLRNYSAAARSIPISQQGLVKAIKSLEKELDCTLFTSDPRSGMPVPTKYADRLHEFVMAYHDARTVLDEDIRTLKQDTNRRIELGLSLGVHNALGVHFPEGFSELHPDIEVSYWESNDDPCEEGLRTGRFDLAIFIVPSKTKGVTPLYISRMYFWFNRDSREFAGLRGKAVLEVEDLEGMDIAIPARGFRCYEHLTGTAAERGVRLGAVSDMSEIFQIYCYVLEGRGIGFCNGTLIDLPCFANEQIVALPVEGLYWGFGITQAPGHSLTPAERKLWDYIRAKSRELPHNLLTNKEFDPSVVG